MPGGISNGSLSLLHNEMLHFESLYFSLPDLFGSCYLYPGSSNQVILQISA